MWSSENSTSGEQTGGADGHKDGYMYEQMGIKWMGKCLNRQRDRWDYGWTHRQREVYDYMDKVQRCGGTERCGQGQDTEMCARMDGWIAE